MELFHGSEMAFRISLTWRLPDGDCPADPEGVERRGARGEEAPGLLGLGRALPRGQVALPAQRVVQQEVQRRAARAAPV